MKNIEYYLKLPYHLKIMPDIYEGGYVASYPELPGCLTCADTLEDGVTIQEPKYNEETIAALKEAEEISKNPSKYKGYSSVEEMIRDILKEDIE